MHTLTLCLILVSFSATFAKIVTDEKETGNINYKFNYGVDNPSTGDVKSHYEVRLGKEVSGVYTIKEADGTTRVVKYTAGPHKGFNAVVQKLGNRKSSSFFGGTKPSTSSTFGSYSSFNGNELRMRGFSGFHTSASEPQVAIIGQEGDGTVFGTPQLDFESIKVP